MFKKKSSLDSVEDKFQLMTFGVCLCLLTVVGAMMIIVNVSKKCEHDAIITHLETQVDNAKRFRDSNLFASLTWVSKWVIIASCLHFFKTLTIIIIATPTVRRQRPTPKVIN